MTINAQQMYTDVISVLQPVVGASVKLIKQNETGAPPAKTYCAFRIKNFKQIGKKEVKPPDDDGIAEIHSLYRFQINFMFVGNGCTENAVNFHSAINKQSVRDGFTAKGMSYYDKSEVKDIPKVLATGIEDRSHVDVFFYTTVVDEDDVGWIETFELEETYQNLGGTVVIERSTIIDLDP